MDLRNRCQGQNSVLEDRTPPAPPRRYPHCPQRGHSLGPLQLPPPSHALHPCFAFTLRETPPAPPPPALAPGLRISPSPRKQGEGKARPPPALSAAGRGWAGRDPWAAVAPPLPVSGLARSPAAPAPAGRRAPGRMLSDPGGEPARAARRSCSSPASPCCPPGGCRAGGWAPATAAERRQRPEVRRPGGRAAAQVGALCAGLPRRPQPPGWLGPQVRHPACSEGAGGGVPGPPQPVARRRADDHPPWTASGPAASPLPLAVRGHRRVAAGARLPPAGAVRGLWSSAGAGSPSVLPASPSWRRVLRGPRAAPCAAAARAPRPCRQAALLRVPRMAVNGVGRAAVSFPPWSIYCLAAFWGLLTGLPATRGWL